VHENKIERGQGKALPACGKCAHSRSRVQEKIGNLWEEGKKKKE